LRKAINQTLEKERIRILEGRTNRAPVKEEIEQGILQGLTTILKPSLRRVINATGVILHTNLGRAPLAQEALDAIKEASAGYSNLEFNLDEGKRCSRYRHVDDLLCELTGAEASLVVNNNAAAVFLALRSLAKEKGCARFKGRARRDRRIIPDP